MTLMRPSYYIAGLFLRLGPYCEIRKERASAHRACLRLRGLRPSLRSVLMEIFSRSKICKSCIANSDSWSLISLKRRGVWVSSRKWRLSLEKRPGANGVAMVSVVETSSSIIPVGVEGLSLTTEESARLPLPGSRKRICLQFFARCSWRWQRISEKCIAKILLISPQEPLTLFALIAISWFLGWSLVLGSCGWVFYAKCRKLPDKPDGVLSEGILGQPTSRLLLLMVVVGVRKGEASFWKIFSLGYSCSGFRFIHLDEEIMTSFPARRSLRLALI